MRIAGKIPLAWGINPSLLETYPDLIAYFYETASPADTFTSDASAAGYMNPNRIRKEYLPLFVRHNQQFFHEADMTIAPMVLDRDQPSPEVKDAFQQFAPDGFATIVADVHGGRGDFRSRRFGKACRSSNCSTTRAIPKPPADRRHHGERHQGSRQQGARVLFLPNDVD